MKKTGCHICAETEIPLNNTITIDGKIYCSNCIDKNFSGKEDLRGRLVEKNFDPTICTSCEKDFGNTELNRIGNYPVCSECETSIRNKTFPNWVKAFFAGVLAIVVISFFWNWKYYSAYRDIRNAAEDFGKNNYQAATAQITAASQKVPEVKDLETLAAFYKGVQLLAEDKSALALNELNKCKDVLPEDYHINSLIIKARIGSSFDNKDYQGFLTAAKDNLALDTATAVSLTSVASAWACIYAEKGTDSAKTAAFSYLQQAKKIDSTSSEMKEYYNIVEYRIYSRKIITREEFKKQFPNGWTPN